MNNLFSKVKNNIKDLHKARLINPHKHWDLLVKFFLILSFILIIFNFYFLYTIRNEQSSQSATDISSRPNLVKENLLENITKAFNNKKIQSIKIKNTNTVFSNVSE